MEVIFILTFKRLRKLLRGNLWLFVLGISFQAGSALANMAAPLVTRIAIDNVLGDQPLSPNLLVMWLVNLLGGIEAWQENIWLAAIAFVIFQLFIAVFVFGRQRVLALGGENTAKRLKDLLYDHIQKLPYNYHVHAKTGDLIQRCTSDVETTRRFLQQQTVEIARAVFFTCFALGIMFTINVTLTLVAMAFLPIIFIFSYIFFKNVRRVFKMADEAEAELTTVLQESLTGVRVVRAFGRARFEVDKFINKNNEFRSLQFRQMKFLSWYWSSSDILCWGQVLIVFIVGIIFTYNDQLTAGELLVFNINTGMMVWPMRQLGRVISDLGRMQVALGRVYEILDTPAEKDTPGAQPHDLRGDIVFKNVDFEYESSEGRKIFDSISFEIKKGETIAVLGATGAGKSTLMHVLLRLYDYGDGNITVNGKELSTISKNHLREKIGIVLQEPFLYSKTIQNNLEMAKDEVSKDEIVEATKTASAHEFIEEFEDGYDTMVGERGVTLSGGQKQRVAIARTLIKNSEMLIFDDSLSAVDTETDAQIRAALSERAGDVTTFIISQRITTLMDADRIFVIEGGKLTDQGSHDELLSRDGLYKRIWDIQSMLEQDFEKEGDA
ncbi:MAG: ABC transporter ATP-binding protein/permease [Defluviitaleaceae bacterium]|nr:ABC transporter ATP-binding protein/permease [Defluviitaleaceae bacterium]